MKITNFPLLVVIYLMISFISNGQTFTISDEGNEVLIKGTSNLHDWQMVVTETSCRADFIIEGDQLKGITSVDFSCNPDDIQSDHDLMDKKTQAALKADKFPEIRFSLLSDNELTSVSGKYRGNLKGKLFIAGVAREVIVPFTATLKNNNTVNVTGSFDLNMSDFNITPPVALLGTLKTGDKVSVFYSLNLSGNTQISSR
jgi:hypothetical protein